MPPFTHCAGASHPKKNVCTKHTKKAGERITVRLLSNFVCKSFQFYKS